MKIIITGGAGVCGSALLNLNYEKIFIDRINKPKLFKRIDYLKTELNKLKKIEKVINKNDILIHLAATDYYPDFKMGSKDTSIKSYNENNIIITKALFDLCIKKNVNKVIFASSTRVQGMYEKIYSKSIYNLKKNIKFDHNSPLCPDSYYAVTKIYGENLANFYSSNYETIFKCIRIGSVRSIQDDHPHAYANYGIKNGLWKKNSKLYNFQKYRLMGIWQSRRDFLHLVNQIILTKNNEFEIYYGLSDNSRKWFNLNYTKKSLKYKSQDNSENFK